MANTTDSGRGLPHSRTLARGFAGHADALASWSAAALCRFPYRLIVGGTAGSQVGFFGGETGFHRSPEEVHAGRVDFHAPAEDVLRLRVDFHGAAEDVLRAAVDFHGSAEDVLRTPGDVLRARVDVHRPRVDVLRRAVEPIFRQKTGFSG